MAPERDYGSKKGGTLMTTHPPRDHSPPNKHNHECPVTVNLKVDCCCSCSSSGGGTPGTTKPGGRPTHQTGTSDGSVSGGLGASGGLVGIPTRPASTWPGTRTELFLPLLFIRTRLGDTGARPVVGAFWESPDILIAPNVGPASAPARPPDLGATARADVENTIYAHVWNLGQAPAHGAIIEFYWFNPTLGFNGTAANFIGKAFVDLDGRGSPGSHKLVKCPFSWIPKFLNGGHECLVVRISHPVTDPLASPPWDASKNRHVGQRNIHVMSAAEAAAKPTLGINVGPLYGQPGQLQVARAETGTMPWLFLATNSRTNIPATGAANGVVGITPPIPVGAGLPKLGTIPDPQAAGVIGDTHSVNGDNQQVGFLATDGNPGSGKANVYRVSGTQNGEAFGGYTVVVLGS